MSDLKQFLKKQGFVNISDPVCEVYSKSINHVTIVISRNRYIVEDPFECTLEYSNWINHIGKITVEKLKELLQKV